MAKSLDELGVPVSIIKKAGSGPFKGSSVIIVECACGVEAELQVNSILRTLKRVGFYRCLSCGMKNKHQDSAYAEKHRSGVVGSWSQERRERQSELSKRMWSDDGFKQRLTEASNAAWQDVDKRQQASATTAELWKNNEYRTRHEQTYSDLDWKQAHSDAACEMWQHPEYAKRQREIKASSEHVEKQKLLAFERWSDADYRQHVSDSLKAYWDDSEMREVVSARVLELWNDPEYLEKQARAAADPKLIALKSENAKRQWQDPSVRKAIVDGIKKVWEDPDYRQHASELSKQKWQDDEYRKIQAVARANMLADGKDSILERTAQTLLNALGIPYVRHHVVGYFEFDLFIPSHNVLIECNGEYWHSLRKDKDAAKFSYVDTYFPEYRVLYLWERDFLNPNLIRHKLIRALFGEQGDAVNQTDFAFDD